MGVSIEGVDWPKEGKWKGANRTRDCTGWTSKGLGRSLAERAMRLGVGFGDKWNVETKKRRKKWEDWGKRLR